MSYLLYLLAVSFLACVANCKECNPTEKECTRGRFSNDATSSSSSSSSNVSIKAPASIPSTLCFERISEELNQINLVPHPFGGRKALISTLTGLIKLVTLPTPGTRAKIKTISVWLNLTKRIKREGGEQGLLGIAFHPKFLTNGRFFVSYTCNSKIVKDCKAPCPCNAATGCNPFVDPIASCNYSLIVGEYTAGKTPKVSTKIYGNEVRRILTIGRPYINHNGGDIFFGTDGYLYVSSGDGGNVGDPWNFAQKGNVLLGKIIRVDVDKRANGKNYSIPPSNPFVNTKGLLPEIYSLGFRNPWRCTVDRVTKAIFCGDVGQSVMEEVDRIVPGANYGWHNFEGTTTYVPDKQLVPKTPVSKMIGKLTSPILTYRVSTLPLKSGAVIGGVVYRGNRNKCLQGKYLFSDYAGPMWVGTVYPPAGAKPSMTRVRYRCSYNSPIKCDSYAGSVDLGLIFYSWGTDLSQNAYLMTYSGIYRLTDLSSCGLASC